MAAPIVAVERVALRTSMKPYSLVGSRLLVRRGHHSIVMAIWSVVQAFEGVARLLLVVKTPVLSQVQGPCFLRKCPHNSSQMVDPVIMEEEVEHPLSHPPKHPPHNSNNYQVKSLFHAHGNSNLLGTPKDRVRTLIVMAGICVCCNRSQGTARVTAIVARLAQRGVVIGMRGRFVALVGKKVESVVGRMMRDESCVELMADAMMARETQGVFVGVMVQSADLQAISEVQRVPQALLKAGLPTRNVKESKMPVPVGTAEIVSMNETQVESAEEDETLQGMTETPEMSGAIGRSNIRRETRDTI